MPQFLLPICICICTLYLCLYLCCWQRQRCLILLVPTPLMFPTLMLSNQPTNQPSNLAAQHQSVLCVFSGVLCIVCNVYVCIFVCICICICFVLRVSCVVVWCACCPFSICIVKGICIWICTCICICIYTCICICICRTSLKSELCCCLVALPPPHLLPLPLFRSGCTSHTTFCLEIQDFYEQCQCFTDKKLETAILHQKCVCCDKFIFDITQIHFFVLDFFAITILQVMMVHFKRDENSAKLISGLYFCCYFAIATPLFSQITRLRGILPPQTNEPHYLHIFTQPRRMMMMTNLCQVLSQKIIMYT